MSNSTFKIGDAVSHKSTEQFKMVIVGNCVFDDPNSTALVSGVMDESRFLCKYYNSVNQRWEEECFYDFELKLSNA